MVTENNIYHENCYIISYIPNPKPKIEYKNSVEKLKQKVERMYKNKINKKSNIIVHNNDV